MEIRQLEYFVAVAETLNFGRAAEQLGIGQPAVSQQIARLERELGLVLINRTSRVVSLSEAGQRFLPAARAVLVAVVSARAVASGDDDERRVLRIGSSTGLGERLDVLLDVMRGVDPFVDLELFSASTKVRLERVRAGQLDAAFVRGLSTAPGLDILPVWQDRLVIALPAGNRAASGHSVELRDLAQLPLHIAPRRRNASLLDLVMSACSTAGFEPVLGTQSTQLQDTLASIGSGAAWTVLYASHARTLRSERVAFRPVAEPGLEMTTALAVPKGTTSMILKLLLRACAEVGTREGLD